MTPSLLIILISLYYEAHSFHVGEYFIKKSRQIIPRIYFIFILSDTLRQDLDTPSTDASFLGLLLTLSFRSKGNKLTNIGT